MLSHPPKNMYHVRFTRICNRCLFPHIFAAYFAITWSAYFEKKFCIFLTCLYSIIQGYAKGFVLGDGAVISVKPSTSNQVVVIKRRAEWAHWYTEVTGSDVQSVDALQTQILRMFSVCRLTGSIVQENLGIWTDVDHIQLQL